jgi:hypothetical protein
VDADEEENQREKRNSKERGNLPERERNSGDKERYVRHQRKHAVKDPVFQFRSVSRYASRSPHNDEAVDDARCSTNPDGGGGV